MKKATRKGMKTGRRAWNKAIRKTGACSRRIRWSQRQDTATAAAITTAATMWMANAIAIYTIHS